MRTALRMEPFEVYQKYIALKNHFTSAKYDYFKYNGKIKLSRDAFEKRRDKYFFYKFSKLKDVEKLLLANMVDGDVNFWVGDIKESSPEEIYRQWLKRQQSLLYTFTEDLGKLKDDFDENILVPEYGHPHLMRLYLRGDICIETVIILNMLTQFFKYWDKQLKDDTLWPDIKNKMLKYQPFLSIEPARYKKKVVEHFS